MAEGLAPSIAGNTAALENDSPQVTGTEEFLLVQAGGLGPVCSAHHASSLASACPTAKEAQFLL